MNLEKGSNPAPASTPAPVATITAPIVNPKSSDSSSSSSSDIVSPASSSSVNLSSSASPSSSYQQTGPSVIQSSINSAEPQLSTSSSSSSFLSFNALLTDLNNNAVAKPREGKSPRRGPTADLDPDTFVANTSSLTPNRSKQQRKSESDVQLQGVGSIDPGLNASKIGKQNSPSDTVKSNNVKNLAFSPIVSAKSGAKSKI